MCALCMCLFVCVSTLLLDYHTTSPVCSPSRAGIMTGRFPGELGIHSALTDTSEGNAEKGDVNFLDPTVPTITRVLQGAGYLVAHYGKWHLGSTTTPLAPPPTQYGINESITFDSADPHQLGNRSDPTWPSMTSSMIVDHAITLMKKATTEKVPFYMNLWFHISHARLDPSVAQKKVYAPKNINSVCRLPSTNETTCPHLIFWASQTDADTQIGRLVEAMHSMDLVEGTLLVFTTDNGPEDPSGYNNAVGSAGPFRGQKRSLYEGGHRVPFIAHMPKTVPSNTVDHSTISGADWLPTVAKMANVSLPGSIADNLDGEDISEVLVSSTKKTERKTALLWDWNLYVSGPCWNHAPRMAIRDGPYKFLQNQDGSRKELYNLDALTADGKGEYFESQNLVNEPDMAETVQRLSTQVMDWWSKLPNATSPKYPGPLAGCESFPLPME